MILDQYGHQLAPFNRGLEQYAANSPGLSEGSIFSRILPFHTEGAELPQPLDFNRLTDDFYRKNAVVYAAVRAISRSASEPQFQAGTIENEIFTPDPSSDPLSRLLAQPNENQEGYEFMEQLIIHLQVAGNAFVHKVRSSNGSVVMMELIRPDIISIIPHKALDGKRVAQYMVDQGGQKIVVPSKDIIHFKMPDALDEFWGLSPLFVLAKYGDIDRQATDFLRTYFLNRGIPSGMLTITGRIHDHNREELKAAWRMQHQGLDGWHTIPIMDQGVKYEALSSGLKDLDLNPIFNQSETRIAMVYGVPPILLGTNAGLQRSTFSNFKESRRGFWTETLVPMYTRLTRRFTKELAQKEFGPNRAIQADLSKVSGLQENREELRNLALKGWREGLFTRDEVRDYLDMPPAPEGEHGDAVKLSTASVYVPIRQAVQFADLVGDVITDIVQEEVVETEVDKIKGVGDPNPAIGEDDNPNPPEQKLKELKEAIKKLEKEMRSAPVAWDPQTGDCLAHETFACSDCQAAMESFPGDKPCYPGDPDPRCRENLDHLEVIRAAIDGDQEALAVLLTYFPGNFADPITNMVDRIVGGALTVESGVAFLEASIGEDLRVIMALFDLAQMFEKAGQTPDEVRNLLFNAKARIHEDDNNG